MCRVMEFEILTAGACGASTKNDRLNRCEVVGDWLDGVQSCLRPPVAGDLMLLPVPSGCKTTYL